MSCTEIVIYTNDTSVNIKNCCPAHRRVARSHVKTAEGMAFLCGRYQMRLWEFIRCEKRDVDTDFDSIPSNNKLTLQYII